MTNYYMLEIDRLKVELEGKTQMYEELYDHHFKEHHTPDYDRIEELERQLSRYKEGVEFEATVEFYNHGIFGGVQGRLPVIDYLPEELIGQHVRVLVMKEVE